MERDIERKLVEVEIGTEVVLGKSELTLHDVTELAPPPEHRLREYGTNAIWTLEARAGDGA